jgi:hypothetical protein
LHGAQNLSNFSVSRAIIERRGRLILSNLSAFYSHPCVRLACQFRISPAFSVAR